MTNSIAVGLNLTPDWAHLGWIEPLILEQAEVLEVAPETLWFAPAAPWERLTPAPNAFHRAFLALVRTTGRPVIAHGVGFGLGSESAADEARTCAWERALRRDSALFGWRWYTDHGGTTALAGRAATLPLPLPASRASAALMARRLARLQRAVGVPVGLETSAHYLHWGDPLREPDCYRQALGDSGVLLLDLENVAVMAEGLGFSAWDWLRRLPLERVRQIHLAGGRWSEPGWLPEGAQVRLDSHDAAVSEPVWALFERVLPFCPALEAVVVERMEGTIQSQAALVGYAAELQRARRLVGLRRLAAGPLAPLERAPLPPGMTAAQRLRWEEALLSVLRAPDPVAACGAHPALGAALAWPSGLRMAALLVARLRFERLLRGAPEAARAYEEDPQGFTRRFRAWHQRTPLEAFFPAADAALWERRAAGADASGGLRQTSE